MDYEKMVRDMLMHVCNDFSKEQYAHFTRAVSMGLGEALALIETREDMLQAANLMFGAIVQHAMECRATLHESEADGGVSAEEFLRDHFKPGSFNG
jgi:hypothetical protein